MMDVLAQPADSTHFANGNIREKMDDQLNFNKDLAILSTPEVMRTLKESQDDLTRELQFYEMVAHVLKKIEREDREEYGQEEEREVQANLWPEVSLLDMKQYLKSKVHSSNVSEHSPIFILEAVNTKLGRLLHSADIYDLRQLAACTDTQIDDLCVRTKSAHVRSEVEYAVADARCVLRILAVEKGQQKGAWDNISNFADLNLKENTQKIANFVWQFNPKGIVDALARPLAADEDDIDAFQTI